MTHKTYFKTMWPNWIELERSRWAERGFQGCQDADGHRTWAERENAERTGNRSDQHETHSSRDPASTQHDRKGKHFELKKENWFIFQSFKMSQVE